MLAMGPMISALAAGILCLFCFRSLLAQRLITVGACMAYTYLGYQLMVATKDGALVVHQLGSWVAPFGIVYAVDLFGSIMVLVSGGLSLAISIFSLSALPAELEKRFFHPNFHFLLMGVFGAFTTGDIFNLYVCFELLLLSSFVLLVLGNRPEQLRASFKYVVLNFLGSLFFLLGLGLLYSQAGTLNMADLSSRIASLESLPTALGLARIFIWIAFASKAALFPLFFWLPASYHTPHPVVSAFFSGLLTKVGVYSIFRVFVLIFPQKDLLGMPLILFISLLTMVVGVLGAVSMSSIRKILSVHIVSQVGYMTLAVTFLRGEFLAAGIFYLIHNMIVKTNLFLVGASVESVEAGGLLKSSGSWLKRSPFLATIFLLSALALAGFPPLSGFFAKFFLLKLLFNSGAYISGGIALAVGVLTLFSMMKIWNEVFFKTRSGTSPRVSLPWTQVIPMIVLAGVILAMGIYADALWDLCLRAGTGLLNREAYIEAVLKGPRI
jgi:multicomponent Na+:H+ antiporter subunit D